MTLNVANNSIDEVRLLIAFDPNMDRVYGVCNLILDGNEFNQNSIHKLAALLFHASDMSKISLNKCKLGDDGLKITFEAL